MQMFSEKAYSSSTNLLLVTTMLSSYFCVTLVNAPAFPFKPS